MISPPRRGWISAKQSPPTPVDGGSITPSSAEPATAASTAVPPSRSTSIAAREACGCEVATIALVAWTVDLPGKWKFLIEVLLSQGSLWGLSWTVGAAGAPSRKTRPYMTHSGPPWQCWHTSEMAAIRWAYRPFAVRGHAGFLGGGRLLNEPP